MAGGFTRSLPSDDRRLQDRSYYEAMMAMALGGHVAEEMIFGEMTTGAHDDIGKVTQIARNMVTQWGMSSRMGPRTFGRRQSMVFLGRDISEERDYSERTAQEIDDEVRRIIDEAHARCRAVLGEHRDKLAELAELLVESETVEGDDLLRVLGPTEGRPLPGTQDHWDRSGTGGGTTESTPTATAEATPESDADETPQGRPGLAWGRQNAASD
jgi:cell division protease FtsH